MSKLCELLKEWRAGCLQLDGEYAEELSEALPSGDAKGAIMLAIELITGTEPHFDGNAWTHPAYVRQWEGKTVVLSHLLCALDHASPDGE